MSFNKVSSALAIGLFALRAAAGAANAAPAYPTCESYGVDFQSGGSYFQNISSTDDFTFVSLFEQCQNDVAYNILVDPNGDEYYCSEVPLQPDDTNQVSTCPIQKDQMWSGPWSVIISSNNGDDGADPIAYERDFNLVVATPVTVTYTPTLTISVTSTPVTSVTSLTTTISSIISTVTTTVPAQTKKPTTTITPSTVTSTKIWTLGTISQTSYLLSPIAVTSTITQYCSRSTQANADPPLTWTPSLLPPQVAASVTPVIASQASSASVVPTGHPKRDSPMMRRVPGDRAARLAARKERLARAGAFEVRGIDQAGVIATITDQSLWQTSTATVYASTSTVTLTSVVTQLTTITSITTLLQGTTTLPVVSITLPTPTKTALKLTVITKIVATVTKKPTYTIFTHTAPASATAICTLKGGRMVG